MQTHFRRRLLLIPLSCFLSTRRQRSGVNVQSITPLPPILLFVWIGLVQPQEKPKVLVSGLQGWAQNTFAACLSCRFSRIRCVISKTCNRLASHVARTARKWEGKRPWAWHTPLEARGHSNFTRMGYLWWTMLFFCLPWCRMTTRSEAINWLISGRFFQFSLDFD